VALPIAGGIGLATRVDGSPDSPSTPEEFFPDIIRSVARQAWDEHKAPLVMHLHDSLGRGDLITAGVTLYDIVLKMPDDVDLTVERTDTGDLLVHVLTGSVYLEATSTTPTDLGSWADPRFSVAFGLDLTFRIDLPPTTQPLSATGFDKVRILSPELDSHNFVADVVFLAADVAAWFGGTDFEGLLEQYIVSTDFADRVNANLAPLNAKLTALAAQGFWFLDALVDRLDGAAPGLHGLSLPGAQPGRLDLLLTAYGFDRSGAIEGEISWPRGFGAPTNAPEIDLSVARVTAQTTRLSAATGAALRPAREGTWLVPDVTAQVSVSAEAASSDTPSVTVGAQAEASVVLALTALGDTDRLVAAEELRAGVADRFISMIGGPDRFAALITEFRRVRSDFTVAVTTPAAGTGLFADLKPAGALSGLWADDDETTMRRRYLLVDVATDAPLTVTAVLAEGHRWRGGPAEVAVVPAGWAGTLTVTPAPLRTPWSDLGDGLVEVRLADHTRAFGSADQLAERGIIIVGGIGDPAGRVALNPQPIPPGAESALNPQPLPPGEVPDRATIDVNQLSHVNRLSRLGRAASVQRLGFSSGLENVAATAGTTIAVDSRWGSPVVRAAGAVASHAALDLVRENPTAVGTARGIDFRVIEYVPPVVR